MTTSSDKSPGSGQWIIPGFVLCRTAHFSLALSVLYQETVSTGVTGLKDPLNLASFLSWQAAVARVMEECLHVSGPRNIFAVLSDKAQSQMGTVVKRALDKESASLGLVSVPSWTRLCKLEPIVQRFLSMQNKQVQCDSLRSCVLGICLGMKVASKLSYHFQNRFAQEEWKRSAMLEI